jgi:hypothetical protein
MESQYINKINDMDYLSLVSMLTKQITPFVRKNILERLTEMNDHLISGMKHHNIMRPISKMTLSKKGSGELDHPSDNIYGRKNPTPQNFSLIHRQNDDDKIDIDDIMNDIYREHEPDDLDAKLARIKKLHSKLIADKRRRRDMNGNSKIH